MASEDSEAPSTVRYEPDEKPPAPLAVGLGLQLALLNVAGVVLTPAIVVRAGGGTEAFLSWAVFAAVAVCGLTTALQARRLGRIGAGYVLLMGTSGAFIAVCIAALAEGGPPMLATLVVVSSLFQFALAARLSLFRRILTPTVAGVVLMLIAVTVMPVIFGMLEDVPEGSAPAAAPLSALTTLLVIAGVALKARGAARLWAPVIGVAAGSIVGAFFGLYDSGRVAGAAWAGLPEGSWPGFDLEFGPAFWALLPAFAFVTLVGAIETIGDSVAIQRVSWRRPRAVDFRAVQGALAADGMGNLLSGLAGTMPNTTYSTSISVTELTGVGARGVGMAAGAAFLAMAFSPKLIAVVLAIPAPVAAAYLAVLLAMLFTVGMKVVAQAGLDYRKGLVAGVAFWIGAGFQSGAIFPGYFPEFLGALLRNGMTAGGLAAVLMTLFLEAAEPGRARLETAFETAALPKIREFLGAFASRSGWDEAMASRLEAASEETLLTLMRGEEARRAPGRRLLLIARREEGGATLEFVAASGEANLQDRIALLGERTAGAPPYGETSLRLLRRFASSVRHQQYHDADIVTLRVEPPARRGGGAGAGG